jgi:hypothetical protein
LVSEHDEHPIERTTVEARQGDRRRLNLRVLATSLGAAVVVLALIYLTFIR